ncbi:uncharacterized protein LOC108239390 isoform X2 [Kryptolebias marmoratus]|uniref:uncharacterized protein LOC108239390 isoform X2 n=1 Tax=Kryptolebias marmoratus TaxID=37003 RepID=UPI000D5308C7|nr:uncharacterized protein LOC108239390 isoform X2 [Kryptolebias marmoratus]
MKAGCKLSFDVFPFFFAEQIMIRSACYLTKHRESDSLMVGSKSTMVLFIIRHFLFFIFLLQASEERNEQRSQTTPSPDGSAQYQEFCLHVPEISHWTSSEPGTQLPTKSVDPTAQTAEPSKPMLPKMATEMESVTTPELKNTYHIRSMFAPPSNPSGRFKKINDCRCNKEKMKRPTETSRATSLIIRYRSETCSSTEYIETLEDGQEVCTNPFSLLGHFFQSKLESATSPVITKPQDVSVSAPSDPPLKTVLTPNIAKPIQVTAIWQCKSCNSFRTNLEDVDPKAVRFLDVKIQPSSCPAHIYINLKDKTVFCLDLFHLKILLQKLEIPPPQEENGDRSLKTRYLKLQAYVCRKMVEIIVFCPFQVAAGCRCHKKAKKLPADTSPVERTTIWLPRKTCSLTEFIERLKDGREVCVTGTSITTYVETLDKDHGREVEVGGGELLKKIKESSEELTARGVLLPNLIEDGVIAQLKELTEHKAMSSNPSSEILIDLPRLCMFCPFLEIWNSIQPNDVKSIRMDLQPSNCPTIIQVNLTDGVILCMDSSWPKCKELLERLELGK